ncbi:MAG TPA: hypothetical protein PKC65_14050 [Pyrinomonadaceae bacterium]|nr:hypothetical protein [Pyrinomonadaceae bacterium]
MKKLRIAAIVILLTTMASAMSGGGLLSYIDVSPTPTCLVR